MTTFEKDSVMSANDRQVGGEHYKAHGTKDLQHWDIVALFKLDYFQGNISKYVFRWREKAGLQDLEKARHYLDKYIELVKAGKVPGAAKPPKVLRVPEAVAQVYEEKSRELMGEPGRSYITGGGDD